MPRRDVRRRAIAALAVYAALILAGLAFALRGVPGVLADDLRDRVPPPSAVSANASTAIELAQGSSTEQIVTQLERAGVVRDGNALRALLDFAGMSPKLQAGRYRFAVDLPPAEIVRLLAAGPERAPGLIVREGLRNEEIGDLVQKDGIANRADWDAALVLPRSAAFLDGRPSGVSLLGYLLPASYAFDGMTTASSLVQAMLDAFGRQVTAEIVAAGRARGMSLHQVVTLASIVERETASAAERPLIAAVFLNRLARDIPLQADPTVQFAVSRIPGNIERFGYWKPRLTVGDLRTASPYNTYINRGLPPGPIANPGLESIRAVVNPAGVDYLYFVASAACDRTHIFESSLAAHNANVERFAASACARD